MDAPDQVWAQQQVVFHEKSEKKSLEHSVLERMENMGIKVVCFFREWTLFTKYACESINFSRKIRKNEILWTLLAQNVVLTELKFL